MKVKELVWGTTSYGAPAAETIVGIYRVVEAISKGWSVTVGGLHSRVLQTSDGRLNFATVDEAKAAAQLDYETRILSAIDLPGDERVDLRDSVIEECAKVADAHCSLWLKGAKKNHSLGPAGLGAGDIARAIRALQPHKGE